MARVLIPFAEPDGAQRAVARCWSSRAIRAFRSTCSPWSSRCVSGKVRIFVTDAHAAAHGARRRAALAAAARGGARRSGIPYRPKSRSGPTRATIRDVTRRADIDRVLLPPARTACSRGGARLHRATARRIRSRWSRSPAMRGVRPHGPCSGLSGLAAAAPALAAGRRAQRRRAVAAVDRAVRRHPAVDRRSCRSPRRRSGITISARSTRVLGARVPRAVRGALRCPAAALHEVVHTLLARIHPVHRPAVRAVHGDRRHPHPRQPARLAALNTGTARASAPCWRASWARPARRCC